MKFIKKPWGAEEIIEHNENYVVKRLTMKKGHRCSLQYHNKKKETIYVISGSLNKGVLTDQLLIIATFP